MVVMGAFAQQKGESNVGISLGYNTGITNTKLTTTINGGSHTDETINREGDNFAFNLDYGYFVANNLRVGAALGYGYNANADTAIHSFTITPNVAYYVKLAPNFYYTPSLALGFGCGSTNERLVDLSGSDDKLTMAGFVSVEQLVKSYFGGIMKGYVNWLGALCRFDLGTSFVYSRPVADIIVEKMGVSFAVAFIATIFEFLIAIPLGIIAARKQYSAVDYTVTVFAMVCISMPTFFVATLLKLVFGVYLGWFEIAGLTSARYYDTLSQFGKIMNIGWHLVLPTITIVIISIGGLMRYTRTNMLEVLNADYIRTARAKGLPEKKVINYHAFRNTLIPIVTLLGGSLPSLFSGALITEQLFSIPGIGYTGYQSMIVGDIPFTMFYLTFMAILTLLGNLIADLLYAAVDPRVRLA